MIRVLTLLWFLASVSLAEELPSLRETFLSHRMIGRQDISLSPSPRRITLVLKMDSPKLISRELILAVLKEKMAHLGFHVSLSEVPIQGITPKFLADLKIIYRPETLRYSLQVELTYGAYEKTETNRFTPRLLWSSTRTDDDVGVNEMQGRLVSLLRNESEKFARSGTWKNSVAAKFEREEFTAQYRRIETPPPTHSTGLNVGVCAGTPALLNLSLGFWGIARLPIQTNISGMYYGSTSRGAQWDVGWIFDRNKHFEQSLGLAVIAFNESKTETRQFLDQSNSLVAGTESITDEKLHLYVGPVYEARWRSLRGQVGISTRTQEDSAKSFRFLIQIGYFFGK